MTIFSDYFRKVRGSVVVLVDVIFGLSISKITKSFDKVFRRDGPWAQNNQLDTGVVSRPRLPRGDLVWWGVCDNRVYTL